MQLVTLFFISGPEIDTVECTEYCSIEFQVDEL